MELRFGRLFILSGLVAAEFAAVLMSMAGDSGTGDRTWAMLITAFGVVDLVVLVPVGGIAALFPIRRARRIALLAGAVMLLLALLVVPCAELDRATNGAPPRSLSTAIEDDLLLLGLAAVPGLAVLGGVVLLDRDDEPETSTATGRRPAPGAIHPWRRG